MKRFALLFVALLSGCTRAEDQGWLGYAEGETAMIAAPGAGWVSGMTIKRGDSVRRGQILFRLDDTRQAAASDVAKASLQAANAQIAEARANLALAQKELQRQTNLVREQAGTAQALDVARANALSARARLAQLEAQANQSKANLTDTSYELSERSITARTEGRVEDIFFREGEYAPAMTPVVAILPPENVFVRFFVPEAEFSKIRMGQKVGIHCDGCADNITATISFIASKQEFTPPVIFSAGNREKLVFKVEARAEGGLRLNPGQPVQVRPL